MGSEEYAPFAGIGNPLNDGALNYECNFSDVFGFFLTDQNGDTQNLALIPQTNLPILVTSVHPNHPVGSGSTCIDDPNNYPQYFSQHVFLNNPPTGYDGYTRSITAVATVNPGETYHIKLAVADATDTVVHSGVFLEAGSFSLGVDLGDDILVASGNAACDGDTITLDTNSASATHTWYLDGNVITGETASTLDVTVPGTYSVDVVFSGNCQTSDEIVIEFVTNPVANPALDLVECDGTGTTQFDLTQNDDDVLGAQAPADYAVSYYATQADADAGTNALTSPYTNTGNPQTIYARIESTSNSDCYDTTTFEIQVTEVVFNDPIDDIEACDDDADGITQFTLSDGDNSVAASAGYAVADVTVTYHLTQADADAGVNALASPYTNVSNPQTIYARLVDNNSTSCFGSVAVDLVVNPLPEVQNVTLQQCDEDGTPDGLTEYNLTQANPDVLVSGNVADFTFTYHLTQADADANINAQNPSPFTNTVNPQIVYVRVEDNITGCYRVAEVTLDVTATDVGDADLETCDDDYDGFAQFTLSDADAAILATLPPGLTVAYYATANDAQLETNQLPDNYTNTVANVQTIFIRVEDANDCYGISNMDLIVNPLPQNNTVADREFCSDTPDVGNIDLSVFDAEVLGTQNAADFTITYHETLADADNSVNALVSPYTNTTNPQTIYVRIEDNVTGCYITTINFDIIINPNPTLVIPTPLEVCDDNVIDGFTEIDLTIKDDEIRGGNPNYAITYYLTQADADAAVNQLPIPYTNISNPQTIYARGQDINTGCYSTVALDLVVEQAPTAFTPTPLEYCDPDSDGFGVFTLEDAELEITGGAPGLTVTYHETLADAQNNVNALTSPYNNIVVDTQTIWVRVESSTIATDCATIVELVLIVNPDPQIDLDLEPLQECDDNTDGFTQFDLTQTATEVLNGIDPALVDISWYETQANADAATNPILVPTSYTNISNPQTLWVRVEYIATGCYKITSFELIVNELPVLTQPSPLEMCDYNNPGDEMEAFTLEDSIAEILNGQTGISITFYETQADADAGTSPITSPYVNTSNPQTIYARAENDVTGCVSTITLDLRVNPIPTPATPTPLEECDTDNDGFASFDLESRTIEIINGELDISITYHETMADAESGTNALVSPYDNIVPNQQTVYARAENNLTGCYTIVELELIVLPSPEVPLDIEDYVLCDDDNNGITQFDLTVMDTVILGSQLPADFILTYHLTQADADTGANPIVNVTNYTNASNPQTIYVRLESVANGCISTGQFDLVVALPPVPVQPTPLEECDDEIADEITVFDLTQKDAEITGGNGSWAVTYYETQADADNDTNAIDPADAYTNTSVGGNPANPQTLYVRVTDTDTGCYAFTTLTIRVLPNPTPSTDPSDLELCDDTNTGDGVEIFDLTVNEAYIINGEAGVSATYHETLEDAEAGTNAIADPTMYTNTTSPQTIWVRVTNDITGCYTLVTFDIIVHPLPDVVAVTDYIACEVNTDGFWSFDLTSKDGEILNGQDPGIFAVTYHETQADADAGINALVSPYINITNPQQIYVNITNTITGCDIATVSFLIEVQEGAEANSDGIPILYEICDDNMETDGNPANDSAQFDLSTQDALILDGQDPANYTVSYYLTQADAEAGVNPLPTLYENITNPQVIYARVDNDTTPDSICYAITTLTLQVNPLPVFDLDDEYTLCVNTNGTEVISQPVLDTGLSDADYSFEWSLNGTVIAGATGSSYTPVQGGVYSVTVTDNLTGCQNSDTATVNESEPPVVTAEVTSLAFADDHVIEAIATGGGVYEYSLDDGPWQESGIFTGVSAGEHVVTARDLNGCGIGSTVVLVIDYPLYFTPNGDGYHDTWNIAGIWTQPNAKIYIFDRYGKLLKQLSPTGDGWNGTYNGEPLPSNDYWFTVEYDEPSDGTRKEFRAHFTLKR